MPESYYKLTYTTTGQQSVLSLDPQRDVTIGIIMPAGATVDVEVVLEENGARHVVDNDLSSSSLKTLDGPVRGVALNIKTLTSGSITFEVLSGYRNA